MYLYKEIKETYSVKNITNNKINRGKWLVGSALMGQDFNNLSNGIYYYEQDTIWSKVLKMENINPYWELHNQTINFLLINQNISVFIEILLKYVSLIKKNEKIVIICSDREISKYLEKYSEITVVDRYLPFYINTELVGTYIKIYLKNSEEYIPLIDCTLFQIKNKKFMEININKFYIDMYSFLTDGKIPKKYYLYKAIYPQTCKEYKELIKNQDEIKFLSLLECCIYLSEEDVQIDNSYSGHTIKKILKKLVFYNVVCNYNLENLKNYIHLNYFNYIKTESSKYRSFYKKIIQKETNLEVLSDRYGVDKNISLYLQGLYQPKMYNTSNQKISYFTDIPFNKKVISLNTFTSAIDHIQARRK